LLVETLQSIECPAVNITKYF